MNKRRNYFIDKGFQSKFIIRFCLLVAAAGLVVLAMVYALAKNATTVSIVNSRVVVRTMADFLFPVLIQTFLVATVLVGIATAVMTLFISHRIAGPAFRFKKVLGALGASDFSGKCIIRKKDYLQDVASAISRMMSDIRGVLKDIDAHIVSVKEAARNMPDDGAAVSLKKEVSELEKAFRNFKF